MSQTRTQTPSKLESFFEAPIYTREELEEKLRRLNEKLERITGKLREFEGALDEIFAMFVCEQAISMGTVWRMFKWRLSIENVVQDAVAELIVKELQLDVATGKYEKLYGVKFTHETERIVGVVLLKENETLKPAVIWTNYEIVGYYEGGER
jgi:hypothetical protein